YHQWLTPQQFGEQFGAADEDIQKITSWLQSQGFQINRVSNGKTFIEFSGTAGQVQQAFHTEIHKYVVNGVAHWANAADPQIPAALTPVVAGVATLYNFEKKPQLVKSNGQFVATYSAGAKPQFTSGGNHALSPADYATIYNINALYQNGYNGRGVTIAVVGRTNINVSDISSFRSTFGLPPNPPQVIVNGPNPGDLGGSEEAEAVLDTTWAGAIAQSATIELVVSATTNTADGADLSEMYIIDNNLGDVMTESFGSCEAAGYTAAEVAAISSLAEQAAAQGITYTVAAGDAGAEGCDDPTETTATGPISVNILAATPYTVAVGGTQFNENGNNSAYWSSTNGTNGESALSYIPEDVWNESCTLAQCGSANAGLWASGGGASMFFTKPPWQTGVPGIPSDGKRDVPDVALTAAGHDAYLLCLDGSCTPDSTGRITFDGYSGTSAATPSFAGIMALVAQYTGSRQGQANYTLYSLAAKENLANCNASSTAALPGSTCVFNDVTVGNNAVPGEAGYGTSSAAYQAGAGYDLATGLGSVNVTNLVYGWNGGTPPPTQTPAGVIGIDQSSAQSSTVVGLTTFTGWALAVNASITSVTIAVDGTPVGSATYGLSRPDICASHAGSPGCPNVGWSYMLDTTTLADGRHVLGVIVTSSAGQNFAISTGFKVANWWADNPMTVDIDTPSAGSAPFSGTVNFGGWVFDTLATIKQVAISIDGVSFGTAAYGGTRTDVCAVYPGKPGCPNVGWNFSLDTTLLADGTHTLAVTGTSASGQSSTISTAFQISNAANNPVLVDIDTPATNSGAFSGGVNFGGWAIDNNSAINYVTIAIDGVSYGNASYGGTRTDVCTVYPGRAGCPYIGWNFLLDTTQTANGTHTLNVTAYGSTHATLSRQFTVSNTTPGNPVTVFIDDPNSQNSIVQGVTRLRGWAISKDAAISSISISIDGVPKGVGSYGVARPDVCAAYPGRAGCPNVGWTLMLDTSLLPDGSHTIVVTARVADSRGAITEQASANSTFTVANWTTANPMRIDIDAPNAASAPYSGVASFGGWVVDDLAGISTVTVSVDGAPVGNATYGGVRADVCAVYPGRAGCPNVGWNFSLDTTLVADGAHQLAITATSSGGQSSTAITSFQVSNAGTDPVKMNIDTPSANQGLTGAAALRGWAVDVNGIPIQSVVVLVDGDLNGTATYGADRPDVCAAFPSAAACPNVGWTYTLNTTAIPNGTHTLQVQATSADGHRYTTSQNFFVTNVQ
ncbi:MAG: hypothetical protein JOY54_02845, partial [Acidobacteriaceae bacterium]|nr:hypothetical protein [Acidobacteriaceae bacterium]